MPHTRTRTHSVLGSHTVTCLWWCSLATIRPFQCQKAYGCRCWGNTEVLGDFCIVSLAQPPFLLINPNRQNAPFSVPPQLAGFQLPLPFLASDTRSLPVAIVQAWAHPLSNRAPGPHSRTDRSHLSFV